MEQLIEFNGVKVLLTTGQKLSEVQNFLDVADAVISVYPSEVRILKQTPGICMCGSKLGPGHQCK